MISEECIPAEEIMVKLNMFFNKNIPDVILFYNCNSNIICESKLKEYLHNKKIIMFQCNSS